MKKDGTLTKAELTALFKASKIVADWSDRHYETMEGAMADGLSSDIFGFYIERSIERDRSKM